jgi:hypothetical protein
VPRLLRLVASSVFAILGVLVGPASVGATVGGGSGGSGGSIWADAWWDGSPQGPGPYIPGPAGGAAVCSWTDVGGSVADFSAAMASAGFPAWFWPTDNSGWSPGAYHVIEWAARVHEGAKSYDHFDVVACPNPGLVPGQIGDAYTLLPQAQPPSGQPEWIWLFWDTVPDPPPGGLPPIIGRAYDEVPLPAPSIHTSPATVDGIDHASIVNFPTWLWIDPADWHTEVAQAAGGGLVATVWATPVSVTWTSSWDFTSPGADPQGGVDLVPTALNLTCDGPGTPYSPKASATSSSPDCGTTFTQSTFGTWTNLQATVKWDVTWALTDTAGVVGGEGTLPPLLRTASVPLRVVQIESVVSAA